MLSEQRMHTTLPVSDLDRARAFWSDRLGFQVVKDLPEFALLLEGPGGTRFTVFISMAEGRGGHTQCAFAVDDIDAEVADLIGRGVTFEEYDYPSLTTVDGIASTPAGRAAWFKDPDGNLIGLVQFD
jgi:catechol 2,3-dioxygenase-like lactoylglutathione lyase family enzyme